MKIAPVGLKNAELFPENLKALLKRIHLEMEPERQALLKARQIRQLHYDKGATPQFLSTDPDLNPAKSVDWKVATIPQDLRDRRVEITGPISNAKMVINMLSANQEGEVANTAMLDFEDSMAPTWENVVAGVENIIGVAHKSLTFLQKDGESEKVYRLDRKNMALPMVRVRGLHMYENNVRVEGRPVSAGLFDLVTTAFHTARVFMADGKTPKFYIPKCEHHVEARWWNRVLQLTEDALEIPIGSLRTTFLIETLPAAFQMEEILYEIRERACGLNVGRWDKIFSDIKTLKMHSDRIMADRGTIDMKREWMSNYAQLLIKTCHRRGASAIGGMSAFTPGKDPDVRNAQIEKVIADKKREAQIGHDGCWVSHPFFIGIARAQFKTPNQFTVMLNEFSEEPDLLPKSTGPKTIEGLRQNIRVGIAYQQGYDRGLGCIAFENLMEDLATLEISRAQVWQWLRHGVSLDDGTKVTEDLVSKLFDEENDRITRELQLSDTDQALFVKAKEKARTLFLSKVLPEFLPTNT